ncbi:hypothetical protein [Anaerocolumna chitinilytica]|uniref:Uncharacterized protein n=1 Tax=Anaerocolumna chitinilytica TaxID=1727145 RepID=A0A7I8DU86_9FIRM|nr:hypothetical protein [Anaerocolumna chitinilytica]BCK00626.1 hypothetical protein bsdcttw_36660 [Anaerocolumna chitinilytica]
MPSKANCIGFAGTDSYDLIIYLAAMLTAAKRKILLSDNSCQKALTFCVPLSDAKVRNRTEICYKGINFLQDINLVPSEEYDFVLADYGNNVNHLGLQGCNTLFLVTDTGLHNIAVIEPLGIQFKNVYLLLREIPEGMKEEYIHKLLQVKGLDEKKSYYFYLDDSDREAMAALQYNNSLSYRELSPSVKFFIWDILQEVFKLGKNEIKLAEKELKRRH